MTDTESLSNRVISKKVSSRERSILIGDIIAVNGHRVNRDVLKQRFSEGDYQIHETQHFLLFTRLEAPTTIIVHWFAPENIDSNIGDYFIQELKPLGILTDSQQFGEIFIAVVSSLFPYDVQRALHLYGTNTLGQYQRFLSSPDSKLSSANSTINTFAKLYQRVFQLQVGKSFLDVGCSFGFLPLLISEHFPSLTQVVGVDIQTKPFSIVRSIAEERKLKNVQFCQADVLGDNFSDLGHFDTVVALHVLEHFTQADMYRALVNLLNVTAHRLIIAVPYEDGEPEVVYGHEQLFTREKLEAIGNWCLEQLEGQGKLLYKDCEGGLLLVERCSQGYLKVNER